MNSHPGLSAALSALILGASPAASAAGDAGQTAHQAKIAISGDGPYYRLTLPATIYASAAHRDLRDVRIRNGKGELVHYAWINDNVSETKVRSHRAAIFPIRHKTDNSTKPTDLTLEFKQSADGSLLSLKTTSSAPAKATAPADWIIDASQIGGCLLEARFMLDEHAEGLFPLTLEASDDLRHWHTIDSNAQLAVLKHGNRKIEQLQLDLHSARAKYLRLRWNDANTTAEIESVIVDSIQQNEALSPLQWFATITPDNCGENYCDYLLPANTPLDSLRITPSEPNTLATATLIGQTQTGVTAHGHHRNPLYILRHKRQATPGETTSTVNIPLAQTVIYRLKMANGEVRSPDLPMNGGLYTSLRLETQGPISLLGQTPPKLEIASLPRSLIFLGRGAPPYTLGWGVDEKQGQALPLATLIPAYQPTVQITASDATVGTALQTGNTAAPAKGKAGEPPKPTSKPVQKSWLWAALGGGLMLLAGMAWSLFRSMDKPENPGRQD